MSENADMQVLGAMITGGVGGDILYINSTTPDPAGFDRIEVLDSVSGGSDRNPILSAPAYPTARKVAITRLAATLSVSVNGGTVDVTTGALAALDTMDTVMLGQSFWPTDPNEYAYMNGYIRSIVFHPPVSDAALPALSTL
jgi:hypothetical protein